MAGLTVLAGLSASCVPETKSIVHNETGQDIDIAISADGSVFTRGALPAGRRLLLQKKLTEIDVIEYRYGGSFCSVAGPALRHPKVGKSGVQELALVACEERRHD